MTKIFNEAIPVRAYDLPLSIDGGYTVQNSGASFTITDNFEMDSLIQVTCSCTLATFSNISSPYTSGATSIYNINLRQNGFGGTPDMIAMVYVKNNLIYALTNTLEVWTFNFSGALIGIDSFLTTGTAISYNGDYLPISSFNFGFVNIDGKLGVAAFMTYQGTTGTGIPVIRAAVNTFAIDVGYPATFFFADNLYYEAPNSYSVVLNYAKSNLGASVFFYLVNSGGDNVFLGYFGFYGFSYLQEFSTLTYSSPPPTDLYDALIPAYIPANLSNSVIAKYLAPLIDFTNGIGVTVLNFLNGFAPTGFQAINYQIAFNAFGTLYSLDFYTNSNSFGNSEMYSEYLTETGIVEFFITLPNVQLVAARGRIGLLAPDTNGNSYFLQTGTYTPIAQQPWQAYDVSNYTRLI